MELLNKLSTNHFDDSIFFKLPHVFVVFPPGAGGNFLSSIIQQLVSGNTSDAININADGTAHNVDNFYMTFGRTTDEQTTYFSLEERENYFLNKIKQRYDKVITPQTVWTHDFTNIPLYKKHFINCKVICITAETVPEKLSCIMLNVTKMMLNDPAAWPVSESVKNSRIARLHKAFNSLAKKWLKDQCDIDEIYQGRYSSHRRLVEYIYTRMLLEQFGINLKNQDTPDSYNNCRYPSDGSGKSQYAIGEHISVYTNIADHCISYGHLIDHSSNKIIELMQKLFNRSISNQEETFILTSVSKYLAKQNKNILNDPINYYVLLKKDCSSFLKDESKIL